MDNNPSSRYEGNSLLFNQLEHELVFCICVFALIPVYSRITQSGMNTRADYKTSLSVFISGKYKA